MFSDLYFQESIYSSCIFRTSLHQMLFYLSLPFLRGVSAMFENLGYLVLVEVGQVDLLTLRVDTDLDRVVVSIISAYVYHHHNNQGYGVISTTFP